jgi:hypothetical protein
MNSLMKSLVIYALSPCAGFITMVAEAPALPPAPARAATAQGAAGEGAAAAANTLVALAGQDQQEVEVEDVPHVVQPGAGRAQATFGNLLLEKAGQQLKVCNL